MKLPYEKRLEASSKGTINNVLLNIKGGIGDVVCCEPTIRYAMKAFKNIEWSLATYAPELFEHIRFKSVFNLSTVEGQPDWDQFLVLNSYEEVTHLVWQFFSHMTTHCIDYPTLVLFGHQMPFEDRAIQLPEFAISHSGVLEALDKKCVIVHAGKHYQSKTIPSWFWNSFIKTLKSADVPVALIGKKAGSSQGYVEIDESVDVDLRDKCSLRETVYLLKNCNWLLSNDSSPIHIAAAGDAFIGFISTLKRADFITHCRNGVYGYKTKNFSVGYFGDHMDYNFNQIHTLSIESVPAAIMKKVLPDPVEVAEFYIKMFKGQL
ncbi:MAG: hypothetical protein IPN68_09865 [Bacteroidetes bacterium]|nr:hypothetical protein [Bacteroidota bacterium]